MQHGGMELVTSQSNYWTAFSAPEKLNSLTVIKICHAVFSICTLA